MLRERVVGYSSNSTRAGAGPQEGDLILKKGKEAKQKVGWVFKWYNLGGRSQQRTRWNISPPHVGDLSPYGHFQGSPTSSIGKRSVRLKIKTNDSSPPGGLLPTATTDGGERNNLIVKTTNQRILSSPSISQGWGASTSTNGRSDRARRRPHVGMERMRGN